MKTINSLRKAHLERKAAKERIARLRAQRDSYLEKARECAVYDHAAGYLFWIKAAREISSEITAQNYA